MTAVTESGRPARTVLELPAGGGYRDVAGLVIGGIAARFELPVDRVDDLLLAVDSVLMQDVAGDTVRIEADVTATALVVRLGPFRRGRIDDAALHRVLTRLVDAVEEVALDGRTGAWLELAVGSHGDGDGT